MSDLDEKLREIIYSLNPGRSWYEERNIGHNNKGELIPELGSNYSEADVYVEKIKKAFLDDKGMTKLMQDMMNMHANMKYDALRLEMAHNDTQYLSGQEWYDKFEKELKHDTKKYQNECPECGAPYNYLEAAKKASGLDT